MPTPTPAPPEPTEVTAAFIVIGNEILSGRTKDVNVAWLATKLGAVGVRLQEVRIVPDRTDAIVGALNDVRGRYDYVFTSGGIGPTHDDITVDCVAAAFGVKATVDARIRAHMEERFKEMGIPMNAARLRMARLPEGAVPIANPLTAAPGFRIGNVHVLAGVPKIMRVMLDAVIPGLRGGAPVHSETVTCAMGEGALAEALADLSQEWPDLDFGSYPAYGPEGPEVSMVVRGTDKARLDGAARALVAMVRRLGATPLRVTGDGRDTA